MTEKEKKSFIENVGTDAVTIADNLLKCFDDDYIQETAKEKFSTSEPTEEQITSVQKEIAKEATKPFYDPKNRDFIENIRTKVN